MNVAPQPSFRTHIAALAHLVGLSVLALPHFGCSDGTDPEIPGEGTESTGGGDPLGGSGHDQATGGTGGIDSENPNGTGGSDPIGTGGSPGEVPGSSRVARVATPLELIPAPGLAGPALKVDLDISGRPTSEVSEPGYVAWATDNAASLEKTIEDITFTFSKKGSNGTELDASWSKAAVQAPHYARLVGDGITVLEGNSGSQIELAISGLPAGQHSVLAWHNITGSSTPGKVSVSVDGAIQQSNVAQTANTTVNSDAATSYVTFTAQVGKAVTLLYSSSASLQINGFELDTPNLAEQAKNPSPGDFDEHVDADDGGVELSWEPSVNAASHDVYFGTDPNVVQAATHDSPEFLGNQNGISLNVDEIHNIDRYYWRVDEIAADGTVTRGNTWYFRPRHLAFPLAEGHGRFSIGGRGGSVIHVTNLNDSGAGSLRDAIETDRGPRTLVFDVSGIIKLNSRLVLNQNYVTVAGQTAPGKGIVIRTAPFGIAGSSDIAVRHLRVRLGAGTTFDGMGLTGANHSIIDHASISWTIDEAFSSRGGKNITLQRTLISECLNVAGHQNYPAGTAHGYAASIGGDIGSFHHNLLAHCEGRNWSLAGGLDPTGHFSGRLDISNNVVYNWGGRTTDGGAHEVNFVGNYYRPGPATTVFHALKADYDNFPGTQQYYCFGNVMPGRFSSSEQNKACVKGYGEPQGYAPFVNQAWFPAHAEIHSAEGAYKSVLSDVGTTQPVFDDHDDRVVDETMKGTTSSKGSKSGKLGLPDHENDVGGYENYPQETRGASWDSDGDGLPDFWEHAAQLNPQSAANDFTESNTDADGNGYTELEEYLAFMGETHRFTEAGQPVSLSLTELFRAYTASPLYSLATNPGQGALKGVAAISGDIVTFTPEDCGLGGFSVTVRDSAGDTMTRSVGVFVKCE